MIMANNMSVTTKQYKKITNTLGIKSAHKKNCSKRYCLNCDKKTLWTYDWLLLHSRCLCCGIDSKYARGVRPIEKCKGN